MSEQETRTPLGEGSPYSVVTKEEFYAFMGPRNVHPRAEPDCSFWETPSRELLGISRPGYKCEGEEVYMLRRSS